MEALLKQLSPSLLVMILPMLLLRLGNHFKNKDGNNSGLDDVVGNLFIASAPAVQAVGDGNESAFKKGLKVVRDTIDGYIGVPTPVPANPFDSQAGFTELNE